MAPRATWKGVLKIALVTIPIKVYPATEASESLGFHQLHATCQTRLQQKRWCPACACEVYSDAIVKGFEFEPGKYVLLLPEELDAVQPPSTKVIDLVHFAPASALPWRAIDRAYFLVADGPEGSARTYALIEEAMTGKVGIGKLALYGREYVVAVEPQPSGLMLYTLHHVAEWRPAPAIGASESLSSAEVQLARRLVTALTGPLDLADFTDAYRDGLRQLIAAKIAGDEIVEPRPVEPQPVLSLHDALTQSLQAVVPPPSKRTRRA